MAKGRRAQTSEISKYNAWLQELIVIDEIRRATHNEFIALDYEPEACLRVFAGINEIYRILRPLLSDKISEMFDKRALDIREECLASYKAARVTRKNNPYASIALTTELWNKLDDYFTDIYTIRHEQGLGIKKKDAPPTDEAIKAKLMQV